MYKTFKCVTAISMMAFIHNVASAVAINLQENFYADPTVTFDDNGFSATLAEDSMLASVLLSNDPFFGDPNVITPATNIAISFDYDFNEGSNDDDEFRVVLFDSDTFTIHNEFFTNVAANGSLSFDLSGFVGETLGLQFELRQFDDNLNSTATISNVRLETVSANVPEFSTTFLLLFGSLLYLGVTRRLM